MALRMKCWGVLLASAMLILLALHCTAPNTAGPWDASILRWFSNVRTPGLDQAMLAITWLGSLFILAPAALIIGVRLAILGQKNHACFLLGALLGAALLGRIAKWWIARLRPDLHPWLGSFPIDPSYPSLHTMQAVAFFLALGLILRKKGFWPLALATATMIAISRLYLQVHFPTDVIAGAAAAAVWTLTLHKMHGAYLEK